MTVTAFSILLSNFVGILRLILKYHNMKKSGMKANVGNFVKFSRDCVSQCQFLKNILKLFESGRSLEYLSTVLSERNTLKLCPMQFPTKFPHRCYPTQWKIGKFCLIFKWLILCKDAPKNLKLKHAKKVAQKCSEKIGQPWCSA